MFEPESGSDDLLRVGEWGGEALVEREAESSRPNSSPSTGSSSSSDWNSVDVRSPTNVSVSLSFCNGLSVSRS